MPGLCPGFFVDFLVTYASSEPSSVTLDRHGEPKPERIALITDFGPSPYIGQINLLVAALAPGLPVINLLDDLPPFRPDLAACLIPALIRGMPPRTLYLCVVDPGVGGERAALALRRGADWFVGPDNGLLAALMSPSAEQDQHLWRIDWRPASGSNSFHGRDLFLPIALALTRGRLPLPCQSIHPERVQGGAGARETGCILYVDHYGNLMTGLDADQASDQARLRAADRLLAHARTFCEVAQGEAFWYRNAFGLVEIAANQMRGDHLLGLKVGDFVAWVAD